jgi:hypothetical protein
MPRRTLRPPPIFALKIKRKVPHAAPRKPFGVPLQRRKAAQKQCADNHLRPKGARIENPLYLAITFNSQNSRQNPASKLSPTGKAALA